MRFLLLLTLPALSSSAGSPNPSTPYGSWNLSVVGGFAVSGYRWQDMLAEFSYSNPTETTPTRITECNWFYDPRIFGYSTPPGTCNSTLFRYDWPNEGAGVTDITLHQTVRDVGDPSKSVNVTGTSQIEYRCGLYSGRTCSASIVVEAFVSS